MHWRRAVAGAGRSGRDRPGRGAAVPAPSLGRRQRPGPPYVDLTASSDFSASPDPFAGDRQVGVVALAGSRVPARWRGRLPQLLVGGCCQEPSDW